MAGDREVWRWNVDSVWHSFCSMQYEACQAKAANNEFMRYHHVRSCILHAVNVVEALLNKEMRRHMESAKISEREIQKRLRSTSLDVKRDTWPSEICGRTVTFRPEVVEIFKAYRDIRDELTHPKRRDHSIYVELDRAQPDALVDAIARAIVTICEGRGVPFPYWVLGWNYVGLDNNMAHPCLGNNMNGFYWSLRGLGFVIAKDVQDAGGVVWDQKYMGDMAAYNRLKEGLASYPEDIEPYCTALPLRPRMTRRWWDHEFIHANIAAARKVAAG